MRRAGCDELAEGTAIRLAAVAVEKRALEATRELAARRVIRVTPRVVSIVEEEEESRKRLEGKNVRAGNFHFQWINC